MSLHKKSIVLMGAGYTTNNMGVFALASGAIASALSAYPRAEIVLFDYNVTPEIYEVKHAGGKALVTLVNIRFSKKVWHRNHIARLIVTALLIRCIPVLSIRKKLLARSRWLGQLESADVLGSIAGGDSFSDIYGLRRLIYVSLPQILALAVGRPLILLPQTIGPFKKWTSKRMAQFILGRATKIYSRDGDGCEHILKLRGKRNWEVRLSYDVGFALEPRISYERMPHWFNEIEPTASVVGLNISGLLYMGGYTRNNMFELQADYRGLMFRLIDYFVRKEKTYVMLVPHVVGRRENSESDIPACHDILRKLKNPAKGRVFLVEEGYDHHETKAIIGRSEFFLGSRMHACIGALSQCVPAVGLAYSGKFLGVYKSVGMEELVIDLRKSDEQGIIKSVGRAYERRGELRLLLEAKMPAVRQSVMDLFKSL
jgi:colanic acid/amylovoran biosynthesis protein